MDKGQLASYETTHGVGIKASKRRELAEKLIHMHDARNRVRNEFLKAFSLVDLWEMEADDPDGLLMFLLNDYSVYRAVQRLSHSREYMSRVHGAWTAVDKLGIERLNYILGRYRLGKDGFLTVTRIFATEEALWQTHSNKHMIWEAMYDVRF